jgi:hypothetical protein
MKDRKFVEKSLKKIRTKLWDLMYSERESFEEGEFDLLDRACILITETIHNVSYSNKEDL